MVSTFVSPVIGQASKLGVSLYEDTKPIELRFGDSLEAKEIVIRAVYRQVLGNAYVMESERLVVPESKLKEGSISVREFVLQVAQSDLYKSRFFDNCPRYRAIELNFKHLLGRAPDSYTETNAHSQILDRGGYIAEINSYLDSEEYQNKFGENIVPYYCGYKTQTGKKIVGFTHLFKLLRGGSSSDKKLTTKDEPRLVGALINNHPSAIIPPSNISSYGGVTDINKLLTNVLSPKETRTTAPVTFVPNYTANIAPVNSPVVSEPGDESQKIAELKQKLALLSSYASIGSSNLSKWQSKGVAGISQDSSFTTTNRGDNSSQQQIIADLEEKIADAQRLATIGEAHLNKWRKRIF